MRIALFVFVTFTVATICQAQNDRALDDTMYREMYRLRYSPEYEKIYNSLPIGKKKVRAKMQGLAQQLVEIYRQYSAVQPDVLAGSPYREAPRTPDPIERQRLNEQAGEVLKVAMLQIFKINQVHGGPTNEARARIMRHVYPAFFGLNGLSLVLLYLIRPEAIATHPYLDSWRPLVGGVVLYNFFRGFIHLAKFTLKLSNKYGVSTLDETTRAFLEPLTEAGIPAFSGEVPAIKALNRLTAIAVDSSFRKRQGKSEFSCEFLMTSPDQLMLNP
ncbi:MAG: hypothetical protein HY074_10460 [Deltaproteobacteria bacterium]|nr:hypothetical protein [Deltaproteobacteria bacterium]